MSMTEILNELPQLDDRDRQTILHRLMELETSLETGESPEMLAAIDAGLQSLDRGPGVPLEEARQRLAGWIAR